LIFLRFSSNRASFARKFAAVVAIWGAFTLVDTLGVPHLDWKSLKEGDSLQTDLLGLVCVALNIAMYAAPLGIAYKVVKTRSVEYMPLPLSMCTLLCSIFWFAYALMVGDVWVMVPNACGIVLGVMQLVIYAMCCGGKVPTARDAPLVNPANGGHDEADAAA
jgi:solute carrier family 50 protein (sugar transporter)